ncbi:uncharacterized protein [Henckelia pumila]|uniref:uncharacterized protein n=1 Tax=Henckelia pumila TaxID=405737 RepID=UPI003C6E2325
MDTTYTSAIRPPILDGTNYGPWKLKMRMYIQSIESRAWQRVLDGWTPSMRDNDVPGPKPRSQWTADENTTAIYNAQSLNVMFTSVDMNIFNLIGTCTCGRDAWEKLQTHCEGSDSVKKTRMRLITSKFEKMRMEESETIMEYNGRLKSLANEVSILGDPISNERLVSKVLRSVPKRFHTKEVKDSDLEENSIVLISKKFTDYLKVINHEEHVANPYTLEGIQKLYEELYNDWNKRNQLNTTLTKENTELKATVARLEILMSKKDLELGLLNSELERAKTTLDKFNSSSSKLDFILTMGLKDHLTDYFEQNGGRVTYGGGAKERIVGKGTLNVEGFPKLHNVLHVEGLNANLISISTRSVYNFYQLGEELACRHSKVYEFSLWHQKRGHVNFKTLKNLSKYEAVRGLPNLKTGVPYVCGACQKGKQTRVAHPMLQHCGTTRCLELLHMDLMGPMEVKSYGDLKGKTAEDDTESSLEISSEEHSVVPDVATPNTTLVPPETIHDENLQENEKVEMITIKDIPSKIQKNHPSSQIIGDVHGTRQTRAKDKVDYRKMVGNKARLIAQGSTQVEGVDFDETFAPVTRIESVRILLEISCHMGIKLYQMDVKSAFFNGILNEEVYVKKPKGFEDPHHLDHVYKLMKALYGLKQAPRAWRKIGHAYAFLLIRSCFWESYRCNWREIRDQGFDPQDIRSEMGHKEPDVAAGVTTPENPSSTPSLPIVPIPMEPVPLAVLMPGEPGNAIDVENLPDFSVLNRVNPAAPMARRSKRQAG